MKENKFTLLFVFLFLFTLFIASIRVDNDDIKIKRLEKENIRLNKEIIDYKWQTDQYEYMFNKYCGCDNK